MNFGVFKKKIEGALLQAASGGALEDNVKKLWFNLYDFQFWMSFVLVVVVGVSYEHLKEGYSHHT